MTQDKNTNLLDTAKATLLEFAPNLSQRDKLEAAVKHGFSMRTIDRYLKGDVRDLDTATLLIKFFKEKITKREQELSAA